MNALERGYFIRHAKRYKKEKKRNRLIKKLFCNLAKDSLNKKIVSFVRFSIKDMGVSNSATYYYDKEKTMIKKIEITLVLRDIKIFINKGTNNDYYNTRTKVVNKYILHNRKNCIRFILYHELYHTKKRLQNIKTTRFEEIQADRYALDKIKGVQND